MARSLDDKLAALLASRKTKSRLRRLTTFPDSNADFSSNAYLSLSQVPELRRNYLSLLEANKNSLFGSGGSRLLDGNSTFVESLENVISRFHGAPAGLLFNTGFDANVALFSVMPQPGDVVIYDELIHASAHDGMRQSRAGRRIAFRHNCVESAEDSSEQKKSLDEILEEITTGENGKVVRDGEKSVFVAVEGVYSMDGDVAPLKDIVACVKRKLPCKNGYIIVDEAHSTGLFGPQGRGLVSELGLEKDIFLRLHTFGKAMSSFGSIVLCSPTVREYLINYARTLIYTTSLPFPCLAGIKVTYDFLASGQGNARIDHLRGLMKHTHDHLLSMCAQYRVPPALLRVNKEAPMSPIIPLFTAHPRSLAQHCSERGFTVRPIVAPTVPIGSERVRVCLHAGNTLVEVTGLLGAVQEWMQTRLEDWEEESGIGQQKARL